MTATNVFNLDSFRKKKATNIFSSHYEETYKISEYLNGLNCRNGYGGCASCQIAIR